ncbi:leucine-rich repeat receptor protein kinase MSP1 [Magnolia sinica]|uniref:leucine-rich repeat receptor protein kinase MSP1 n=1 Tax=Magnolia sinica TaxID=86752 RepID=UPI002659E395|nr:leucine-rich repeat receptor protein kinase MSP1 [Magnolia sinica]
MASTSATLFLSFSLISISIPPILSSSIIEDLNQPLPPHFQATIVKNCIENPSLRYCGASSSDLSNIFKSTVVAHHLCTESNNPNCLDSFTKIDLRAHPIITPLYLSFNFFWKYCPLTISTIDLSNNSLKGAFPTDVLHCTQIQSLDLSHNNLIGDVPISTLSNLTNLTFLNLSYNSFSESNISKTQLFKRFNSSSFLHSGLLADDHKLNVGPIILVICFMIFIVMMIGCFGWVCFTRPDLLPLFFQRRHHFTTAMIKAATDGFSEENLVARSWTVEIYGGVMRDGTAIAIEIYRGKISSVLHREFIEGCRILVQMDHKNLVPVLGWCDCRELRAVVMRWTDGDSVEKWLLGGPPWKVRLKVLMGVIEAMRYLEDQWPRVGYDLRTSSVLLSRDCEPLISRFKVRDQISTSKKVYRLGMFLLELVANRRPREDFERGDMGFIEWMRLHYPGEVRKVMDGWMKKTSTTSDQAKRAIAGTRIQPSAQVRRARAPHRGVSTLKDISARSHGSKVKKEEQFEGGRMQSRAPSEGRGTIASPDL